MSCFFVDYENVHVDETDDMELIQNGDTIVIMYSENNRNITLDTIQKFSAKGAAIKCFKVPVGTKNALDFQLSSYLGYTIGRQTAPETEYFIVAKDTGYDKLCEFWSERGIPVKRICNLSMPTQPASVAPQQKTVSKKKANPKMVTQEEIEQYLSPEDSPTETLKIVNQYKTKPEIYRGISRIWKSSERTGEIYRKLKPLLTKKGKA